MHNRPKNIPKNAPQSSDRRSAIKKIAVGVGVLAGYSALPEKWVQPIVGQFVLPAHAQTSGSLLCEVIVTLISGDQTSSTVTVQVSGCTNPPTANVDLVIAVQGYYAANAGAAMQAGASVARSVSQAVVVEEITCNEITQNTTTDIDGTFSINIDVECGPGIASVGAGVKTADGSSESSSAKGSINIPEDGSSTTAEPGVTTTTTTVDPGVTTTTTTVDPGVITTTTTTADPGVTTTPAPTTTSEYDNCVQECLDDGADEDFCKDACDNYPH